ncbi:structural protein VP9 [Sulfolobus polyhedral virus 1]|uniref:Structural protein VP9 n=1 Tax=Sulfolobus polyhedral virus 1 TaxID=1982658 RepID=A0A1W6I167_SPV1|nr:structural protein VP9 [Sulfolobus polyhedral virus 1]ARM37808.1 structural protein VP9 [Sulfolobus polyhedral virus 1]
MLEIALNSSGIGAKLLFLDLSSEITSLNQITDITVCLDEQCAVPLYSYVALANNSLTNTVIYTNVPFPQPAKLYVRKSNLGQTYTGMSSWVAQQLGLTNWNDTGSQVFPYYFSFAGSIPSAFTTAYNQTNPTNSQYYTTFNPGNAITTSSTYGVNYMLELLYIVTSGTSGFFTFGWGSANATNTFFINNYGQLTYGYTSSGIAYEMQYTGVSPFYNIYLVNGTSVSQALLSTNQNLVAITILGNNSNLYYYELQPTYTNYQTQPSQPTQTPANPYSSPAALNNTSTNLTIGSGGITVQVYAMWLRQMPIASHLPGYLATPAVGTYVTSMPSDPYYYNRSVISLVPTSGIQFGVALPP